MWMTIPDAVERTKTSRATWFRRIQEGHPSKIEKDKRFVWVDDLSAIRAELVELRKEISCMRQELQQSHGETSFRRKDQTQSHAETAESQRETSFRRKNQTQSHAETACPKLMKIRTAEKRTRDVLELVEQTWTGTDAELERGAGIPRGWLHRQRLYAKQGKSVRKSSLASRERLRAFLLSLQSSAAA